MNARVHYWIICDAVAYIKSHGNELQRKALQTFEAAYGQNGPVEEMPTGKSAVEQLVGFEAWHTDKFGDLALCIRNLPWGDKKNLVGLVGRMFTAFNHFIHPYESNADAWARTDGYSYGSSSRQGFDSAIVGGISEYFKGMVDTENSLVLDRIKPYWKKGNPEWSDNFEKELRHTTFAPWCVLVRVYYSNLLYDHFTPLEVRGPNKNIVGLQFLGPVAHAAADACSPHHVRPTLGLGHHVWENYVQARVYNRTIDLNPELVRHILTQPPFEPWLTWTEGPMQGRFDVETFIQRLSVKTAERLRQSWAAQSWEEIRQAGEEFWQRYLKGAAMMTDAHYFYNQAVAAAIHVIVRSCSDLLSEGILDPHKGLAQPGSMPQMELIQNELPAPPSKRLHMDDIPPEAVRPIPFERERDILGFDPMGESGLLNRVKQLGRIFDPFVAADSDDREVADLLADVENSMLQQYQRMADRSDDHFCPVRAQERIPLDSDISAHFGNATFRLPSEVECNDPVMLDRYMKQVDAHAKKAYTLELAQTLATLRFYRSMHREEGAAAEKLDQLMNRLRTHRDALATGRQSIPLMHTHKPVQPARLENAPRKAAETVAESRSLKDAAREWFSSLFRIPVMTLATVAAAVLLLVILYPKGVPEDMIALSGTQWAEPSFKFMGPKPRLKVSASPAVEKPKLALVLVFRNFRKGVDQSLVDSLYNALQPTVRMKQHYQVIAPYQIKEAVTTGQLSVAPAKNFMDGLHDKLNVSKVLTVTVIAAGERFGLNGEFKDLTTGESRKFKMEKEVSATDLPSAVRNSVLFFFKN